MSSHTVRTSFCVRSCSRCSRLEHREAGRSSNNDLFVRLRLCVFVRVRMFVTITHITILSHSSSPPLPPFSFRHPSLGSLFLPPLSPWPFWLVPSSLLPSSICPHLPLHESLSVPQPSTLYPLLLFALYSMLVFVNAVSSHSSRQSLSNFAIIVTQGFDTIPPHLASLLPSPPLPNLISFYSSRRAPSVL